MALGHRSHWILASLLAGAPALATPPGESEPATASQLDEIVVTARKKSEALQDVPMSVVALDAALLEDLDIRSLTDLATYVPGLQQQELAITSRMTLRGVNSGDNNAFEQSVGTYVDGIYRGRMNQQHIGLFDLARIEVLKGPQVTLYGNSAIGGAISAITRKPAFEFGGQVRLAYETEYEEPRAEAGIDLPVSENLALRVAGTWRDQGKGISPNAASGKTEPTSDEHAFRLGALWLPTDALTVNFRHEQGDLAREGHLFDVYKHVDGHGNPWPNTYFSGFDDGRLNIGNGAPFKYRNAFLETQMEETELQLDQAFDAFTLTSITGYSRYDYRQSMDVDLTPATLINVYQDERYRQFSQELRVAGEASDRIEYLVGAYYQRDDFRNDYLSDFNLPALLAPAFGIPVALAGQLIDPFSRHVLLDQQTEQSALFGNLDFALTDTLKATLGLRYLAIDKDALQATRTANLDHADTPGRLVDVRWLNAQLAPLLLGNPGYLANPTGYVLVLPDGTRIDPVLAPEHVVGYAIVSNGHASPHEFAGLQRSERHPMFHASLAWQPSSDLLVYANWANGAKAGGFDFNYEGGNRSEAEYADENANVVELGFKREWQDVRLNLALFYGKYEDLQVSVFDGGIGFLVGNAASSISKGLDAELAWAIDEHFRLLAQMEVLDFRYDEFADANCSTTERLNTGQTICDWSGDRAPFVPAFESLVLLEHRQPIHADWTLQQQLGWTYKGSHTTASDNEAQTRQAAYSLFGYRAELSSPGSDWSFALTAKNLLDEEYNVFTSVIPLAPGGAFASVRPRGREVAVEAKYRF